MINKQSNNTTFTWKTIIEFTIEYIKINKSKTKVIDHINHIRYCKKMLLLMELVRCRGREKIDTFHDINKPSLM